MKKAKLSSSAQDIVIRSVDLKRDGAVQEFFLARADEHKRFFVVFDLENPAPSALSIHLTGRGAGAAVFVLYTGRGASCNALRVTLSHEAPNTYGRVIFRAALYDASRVDFAGMLYIAKGADGSDSYLSAKALMLSDSAIARIDPKLEILANSVKASHGATVGRLSEQDLFYFQSRGVDRKAAERVLVEAFLCEAANRP